MSFDNKLIEDIINDYNVYKDLRKVSIIDEGGYNITINSLSIGKEYILSYVFGKYHPIKNSNFSGNRLPNDRRIKLSSMPFFLIIKRDYLDNMFNTSRITLPKNILTEYITEPNYKRNPNIGNYAVSINKENEYKISNKLANKLFNFFINEYNKKYPQLKNSIYKSSMNIGDINKNLPPLIKYLHFNTIDNINTTISIYTNDNINNLLKIVKNMTYAEYIVFNKKRQEDRYKEFDIIVQNKIDEYRNLLISFFNKNGLDINQDFIIKNFIKDYEFTVELKFNVNNCNDNVIEKLEGLSIDGYIGNLINKSTFREYIYYAFKFELK